MMDDDAYGQEYLTDERLPYPDAWGVSKARVGQIHQQALANLRRQRSRN